MFFLQQPIYKLNKDLIRNLFMNDYEDDDDDLDYNEDIWSALSENSAAIPILDEFIYEVDWFKASGSINDLSFLKQNSNKIKYNDLARNKYAIPLIEQNLDKFDGEGWEAIYPKENMGWNNLCSNINAVHIIERNLDKLHQMGWQILAGNINAVHLIEQNLHRLDEKGWLKLVGNINAVHIIEKNIDKLSRYNLCKFAANPNAYPIIKKYWPKFSVEHHFWGSLARNTDIRAIRLYDKCSPKVYFPFFAENINAVPTIEKNLHKLNSEGWQSLAGNKNATHLIAKNLHRLKTKGWNELAGNINATHIMEKYLDKLDANGWRNLSENPNATHLLRKNMNKINLLGVASNPNIMHLFADLDYKAMKKNNMGVAEELVGVVFNPTRLTKMADTHGYDFFDLMDEV